MQNQEWWRDYTQLLHFADGSTEINIHEKDIPVILAEHRKMVVREIRGAVERIKKVDAPVISSRLENNHWITEAQINPFTHINNQTIDDILSLPELKEEK